MWRYIYVTWHLSLLNTGWYACSLWGVYYCYLKICHSFEKTEQRSDIWKFAVVSALLACTSCTLYWRPNCSGAPHMHNVSQCFLLLDLLSWCCPRHVLTHIWAAESPISWKCMHGQQWCVFLAALIEWCSSVYGASATCSIILRWGQFFLWVHVWYAVISYFEHHSNSLIDTLGGSLWFPCLHLQVKACHLRSWPATCTSKQPCNSLF